MNKIRAIPKDVTRFPNGKTSGRPFWLSIISLGLLLVSLFVFYPLSMRINDFSELMLTILALGFYLLQGASFVLCMLSIARIFEKREPKKSKPGWPVLLINLLILGIFIYEASWLLHHI